MSVFAIFPVMFGLAAIADPLVEVVLTSRWAGIVPYFRLLCLDLMLYPVHALNMSLLQVMGRSDLYLRNEVIKKIIGIAILAMTIRYGILCMCVAKVASSCIYLIPNIFFTSRVVDFGYAKQLYIIIPRILLSVFMAIIIYISISFIENPWIQVMSGIAIGLVCYMLLSYIVGIKDMKELFLILKTMIKR